MCCDNLQPYHTSNHSTIVFDSGFWNCFDNPRLASGDPIVCTRQEYELIAEKAAVLGLDERICCEMNCCGMPCWGHGLPISNIQNILQGSFPNLAITIEDTYQGCDDQGHWEFTVIIRRPALTRRVATGSTTSGAVRATRISTGPHSQSMNR